MVKTPAGEEPLLLSCSHQDLMNEIFDAAARPDIHVVSPDNAVVVVLNSQELSWLDFG